MAKKVYLFEEDIELIETLLNLFCLSNDETEFLNYLLKSFFSGVQIEYESLFRLKKLAKKYIPDYDE